MRLKKTRENAKCYHFQCFVLNTNRVHVSWHFILDFCSTSDETFFKTENKRAHTGMCRLFYTNSIHRHHLFRSIVISMFRIRRWDKNYSVYNFDSSRKIWSFFIAKKSDKTWYDMSLQFSGWHVFHAALIICIVFKSSCLINLRLILSNYSFKLFRWSLLYNYGPLRKWISKMVNPTKGYVTRALARGE